ncbi:MAG: hypothetical protein IPP25_13580 [Saprospiraceae bacterium]|nr:hypothetical protein [Candidatus Opimibacter skivensis]
MICWRKGWDYDIVVVDESNCPVTDQVTIDGSEAPRLMLSIIPLPIVAKPDGQLEVEGDLGTSVIYVFNQWRTIYN